MALLAKAGIYVIVGLPTSAPSTDGTTTTFRPYNSQLLDDCFSTIDCMSQYTNTLGLVVANGALSTIYSTAMAPMIKTVVRDVKKYMTTAAAVAGQRRLPVGYSASTTRLILKTTFDYFAAGERDEVVDFFCVSSCPYPIRCLDCADGRLLVCKLQLVWAVVDAHLGIQQRGKTSQSNTVLPALLTSFQLKVFADTHIPIFFSQYGCNLGGDRIFQETTAIFSPAMTQVFSGGVAYEFYEHQDSHDPDHSGYGLVKPENATVGRGLTLLPDFYSLKARLADCAEVEPATDADHVNVVEAERQGYPPLSGHWKAGYTMPYSLVDWTQAGRKVGEERWIDVKVEDPSSDSVLPTLLLPRQVKA